MRFLDLRPAQEAEAHPIADSVNIPRGDLPDRMHELPARHEPIVLPSCCVEWAADLEKLGRRVEVSDDWVYGQSDPGRLWRGNLLLESILANLTPGFAIDAACGSGRDAVTLAASGWRVLAIDVLPGALEKGKDLAHRYLGAAGATRIEWRLLDLETGAPDLPLADLLTMFWYLNRPLLHRASTLLCPGGSLVAETFTSVHRSRFGKPRTAAFVLDPGELSTLAEPLVTEFYEEDWHEGRHSARIWARSSPTPS